MDFTLFKFNVNVITKGKIIFQKIICQLEFPNKQKWALSGTHTNYITKILYMPFTKVIMAKKIFSGEKNTITA